MEDMRINAFSTKWRAAQRFAVDRMLSIFTTCPVTLCNQATTHNLSVILIIKKSHDSAKNREPHSGSVR